MTEWYKVFLPCIFNKKKCSGKGLAMATNRPTDLDLLGVSWWYVWGWGSSTDPRYVPMTRDFSCPTKPEPKYLLVGNEPNAVEPYGYTCSPDHAAHFVLAIQAAYPNTTLIVGNVSADNWGMGGDGVWWLTRFLQYYEDIAGKPFDQILGCHEYGYDPQRMALQFDKYRDVYDGEMWLTEYNLAQVPINVDDFREVTQIAINSFERIACYTNQQDGGGSSLPYPMDLCPDGVLSDIGKAYLEL